MTTNLYKIQEYYGRIDRNDVEWVLALFAEDAVYERADSTFRGAAELRRFFGAERQIRGRHDIEHCWPIGADVVAVMGRFEGVGAKGDKRSLGFCDFWFFGADGLVKKRRSYLAAGHQIVLA